MKTQLLKGLVDCESYRNLIELILICLEEPNQEAVLSFQITTGQSRDITRAHDTVAQHQLDDLRKDHFQLPCSRLLLDARVLGQTRKLKHDLCSILTAIDDRLN